MTTLEILAIASFVVIIALAISIAHKLDEDFDEINEDLDIERRQVDQPIDFVCRRKNED